MKADRRLVLCEFEGRNAWHYGRDASDCQYGTENHGSDNCWITENDKRNAWLLGFDLAKCAFLTLALGNSDDDEESCAIGYSC